MPLGNDPFDLGNDPDSDFGSVPPSTGAPDLDILLGLPVFGIAEGSGTCEAGSLADLHVPFTAALSADGTAYDPTADGTAYDPTGTPPQLALTRGAAPEPEDWQAGDWLTRTAQAAPGLYARLRLTETPPAGRYRVYVQASGLILRAPGYVIFE